jgi:hypothetical protein
MKFVRFLIPSHLALTATALAAPFTGNISCHVAGHGASLAGVAIVGVLFGVGTLARRLK